MCLIGVAHGLSPKFPFVLAANRDELHARETGPLARWPGNPQLVAGRDLVAGGTWLAASAAGRVAAVTNLHTAANRGTRTSPASGPTRPTPASGHLSRGSLVVDFVGTDIETDRYIERIVATRDDYGPFNLLLFDGESLHVLGSGTDPVRLSPAAYGLANARIEEEWPKAAQARNAVAAALDADSLSGIESRLFGFLGQPGDPALGPDYRSDVFVRGPHFGTRSSSVVVMTEPGESSFAERRYDADGALIGETRDRLGG